LLRTVDPRDGRAGEARRVSAFPTFRGSDYGIFRVVKP
jgi:hypothetical protein